MSEIKAVAIAGASGSLGPHVLKALVDANLQVTILTRAKKPGVYNASVKVVEVDFTSVESLTVAPKGIDGLVSTVAHAATEGQTVLIDDAIAAGVKRFIPSEYGNCTTNPKLEALPIYASMFKIKQYLQEKSRAEKLTWTVLAPGAFLEFLFGGPLLLDFANHKVSLYDEGDNRISFPSLPNIGKAIIGIRRTNELLRIAKGLRPDIKWEINKVRTSVILREGLDELSAGDFSMPVVMKMLTGTACAGNVFGAAYDETDNELLGVQELTEEDLNKLGAGKLA